MTKTLQLLGEGNKRILHNMICP